jgi:hypothetical protein
MSDKGTDKISKIGNAFSTWYNIAAFIIMVATAVGNYLITNYRLDAQEKNIVKLEERVSKREQINYDLIVEQLKAIESANENLNTKVEKTNERVDKVLEILLDSK